MFALAEHRIGYRNRKASVFMGGRLRRLRAFFAAALLMGHALPRFTGAVLLGGFLSGALLFGIMQGGHGEQAMKMLVSSFGLAVAKIEIAGIDQTSEIDVLSVMGLDGDSALPMLDVTTAQKNILALPWVKSVVLRKNYPDHLHVAIEEHHALALWQHQGQLDIIDEQGGVVIPFTLGQGRPLGRNLPLLVGRGANENGAQILDVVENFPDFKARIRAYRRVGDRRWDIVLDNGIEVKLPERNVLKRLGQLLAIDERDGLLSRDVMSIDLRLEDRMSVALSDAALAQWQEGQKQAEKIRLQEKQRLAGRG